MRQMHPEPIIQNEVSQKEKHKYCILAHVYGIKKDGNDDPTWTELRRPGGCSEQ